MGGIGSVTAVPGSTTKTLTAITQGALDVVPIGIQLRRTRGWRKPTTAVVVARPTHWGNPFAIGDEVQHRLADGSWQTVTIDDRQHAVELFRGWLDSPADYAAATRITELRAQQILTRVGELAGHDLACWCPIGQPCHRDVLLELAASTGTV